jgi:hypothetical protein
MATTPDTFLGLFKASQLERGSTAGFGRCNAVADFVGGGHVDERVKLLVQFLFRVVSTRDPAHDGRQSMQECHAPSRHLGR